MKLNYIEIKLKIYTKKVTICTSYLKEKKIWMSQDVKKFIPITINGKSAQKAGSIATLNAITDPWPKNRPAFCSREESTNRIATSFNFFIIQITFFLLNRLVY